MKKTIITIILLTLTALSVSAQNIIGAWETRKDGVVWVISFAEDTFVIYKNGSCYQYGPYTLEPSKWGVKVTANNPQNLLMEFGFERSYNGFTYNISANDLVLSNPLRSSDGYIISSYEWGLPLGTYKRSSEPSEAGNPLIGVWRFDYKNGKGEDQTVILHFFPNGEGVRVGFPRLYSLYNANLLDLSYEFGTTRRTGQISLWAIDTSTPNWKHFVFAVFPFTVDGNILRVEKNSDGESMGGEFRKR